ncbi:lipid droplet assembly factor 1-like [Branchiostoma lanceolatum]|uniref:lipid droplet assembly factor 1-like n=1 Tax=Branchiostoma lanceolatum TaxID=7740 RepID=UPI003453BA91
MGSESVGTSLHDLRNSTYALVQRVYRSQQVQQSLQYANENPILTLFLTLVVAMGTMPFLMFLFFVIGSLIFTFSGFLVVEGFLLTAACLVLAGVLSGAAFVAILLTLTVSASWFVLSQGHEMFATVKSRLQDHFKGTIKIVPPGEDIGRPHHDKEQQEEEKEKEEMPNAA